MFEEGNRLAKIYGAENVFDFSIGNPSVPPPAEVDKTIVNIMENLNPIAAHGYPSAEGDPAVRAKIAVNLNKKYGTDYTEKNIFMTTGAAAALGICFNSLTDRGAGDEIITFAPFFPEYRVFIENAGGKIVVSQPEAKTFQIASVMQTNRKLGMITMDDALLELYRAGDISLENAINYAQDPVALRKRLY